jgi:hypothetical protein
LNPALAKVLKLRPKSYVFKDARDADRSIGFIAQEVAELFPQLVEGDPSGEGILSLDYSGFAVLAIKAIQEQQEIIEKLSQRLSELELLLEEH